MKVLVIGDPHFKVGNVPETIEMTNLLVKLAEERQPKIIICLGDILHRHESIHVIPLMNAENMIKRLSKIAPTFLIIGNHDRPNNSNYLTDEHPFNALKEWNNTFIADKVMDITIENKRFLLAAYVPPGRFQEALDTVNDPLGENDSIKPTAIFCHQEFFGAKMGAIVSQAGDKWSTGNPLIISGHVHDYDRLQENLIYVGTPLQHAFGDRNDKTVSIFTFTDTWTEERIDLGLMKRVIIYLKPIEVHTYEPPTDKLVKLVIRGDESEIKAIAKLEKIKELKAKGIKIAFKTITANNPTEYKNAIRLSYKDHLYSEISTDSGQLKWFEKLFT